MNCPQCGDDLLEETAGCVRCALTTRGPELVVQLLRDCRHTRTELVGRRRFQPVRWCLDCGTLFLDGQLVARRHHGAWTLAAMLEPAERK